MENKDKSKNIDILHFERDLRYEIEDIRPRSGIDNFLCVEQISRILPFKSYQKAMATGGIEPMPCPGFEGFEKRLEIEFFSPSSSTESQNKGLRALSLSDLDEILTAAQCTIVSGLSNSFFDSYVLSESSLFVYPFKIIIKTCGTTQLLKSIPPLLSHASRLSLRVRRCRYSRGTFLFPAAQPFPHRNFSEEVKFLDTHFATLGSSGSKAYVMGHESRKINWHVYSAVSDEDSNPSPPIYTLEVCMTELDRNIAAQFFKKPGHETANDMTVSSGIVNLLPNSQICDFAFDPCGYSMNSIESDGYSTIHITPEDGFSYASFEVMGYDPRTLDLQDLLDRVAVTFNPSTLSFSVYTNASQEEEGGGGEPLNSWVVSAHPADYQCETTTRQELPAGGIIVFHTFTKHGSNGNTSTKVPLGVFTREEIVQMDSKTMKDCINICLRLSCGLDAAATRSLQADAISSSAAAVDMGRRY
eukprot:Gb_23426 [translate_table: standard]